MTRSSERGAAALPARRPLAVVLVLALLALAPFLAKPWFTDDPLVLRSAEAVLADPLRPYAATTNWFGETRALADTTFNPPLLAYVLAPVVAAFGASEVALHTVLLAPALLALAATWRLARRWCTRPALAAILLLASPAFLVSATSVMPDVTFVAALLWALERWIVADELESAGARSTGARLTACACALVAALTKHFGLLALPLCALATLAHASTARTDAGGRTPRDLGAPFAARVGATRLRALAWLALPLVGLALVEAWNAHAYGEALLLRAAREDRAIRATLVEPAWMRGLAALAFLGGSAAPLAFVAPWMLARARLVAAVGGAVLAGLLLAFVPLEAHAHFDPGAGVGVRVQAALWIAVAAGALALAARAIARPRDGADVLLGAWVLLVAGFATFVNWGVNARTLLPLAPAVAVLAVRALDERSAVGATRAGRSGLLVAVGAALVLALLVALGELELARSQRDHAVELTARAQREGRAAFVQGHWGFQRYAESAGATSLERNGAPPPPGSAELVPARNTGVWLPPPERIAAVDRVTHALHLPLTTFGWEAGASFHAHTMGLLPFAWNRGAPDEVAYVVTR